MLSDLIMQVNSKWYWHESKSGNQHLFLWKKERVFKKFKYNMKRWSFHCCCAFYNSRRGLNWNRDDSRIRLSKICEVRSTDLKKDVAAHLFEKEKRIFNTQKSEDRSTVRVKDSEPVYFLQRLAHRAGLKHKNREKSEWFGVSSPCGRAG